MKIAARMLVSPAGALIALVSFFLPWYDFNCDGKVITTYGYEAGWPFWIAPIAAAGMLIAFAVGIARKNPRAARTAIRVLALALPVVIGLVVFLVVSEDARVGLAAATPESDPDYYGLRIGFLGTIAGLALAFIGTFRLPDRPPD